MAEWRDLNRELDAWREKEMPATFWWRDDDATHWTPALERLLDLAGAMDVRDIEIAPVNDHWARHWGDNLYATLPPVTFTPTTDRHRLIPGTLTRLYAGETVRVVMLGDSISQDTCNSYFDIFVEPDYPGADLQLVPSVDGSKGCWYYIDDNLCLIKTYSCAV